MWARTDKVDSKASVAHSLRIHLFVFKQHAIILNIHKQEPPTYTDTLCEHCFDPVHSGLGTWNQKENEWQGAPGDHVLQIRIPMKPLEKFMGYYVSIEDSYAVSIAHRFNT